MQQTYTVKKEVMNLFDFPSWPPICEEEFFPHILSITPDAFFHKTKDVAQKISPFVYSFHVTDMCLISPSTWLCDYEGITIYISLS